MNLILLEDADFVAPDRVSLEGRRFRHINDVLRSREGNTLKVGALGGKTGIGRIIHKSASSLELAVTLESDPPAPLPVTVLLALPRPKVVRRVLCSLTVLGVKRIFLMNAARVEKSYWQTPFLQQTEIRRQLVLGLEQAGDTILPQVELRPRFKPFVEDELPRSSNGSLRLVAHPAAVGEIPPVSDRKVTLAIGPEGGFVPFEVDLLVSLGFTPVTMGPRILNVETAVPVMLSRLKK